VRILARLFLAVLVVATALVLIFIVGLFTYRFPPIWLENVVLVVLATAFGPIYLLAVAPGAWPVALGVLVGVGICGGLSWHYSRTYPESEAYGVPIMAAMMLWALSPWVAKLL
jgi:hypothetical protein